MAKTDVPAKPVPTKFDSWRSAFVWAYYVSRMSHQRTKVAKVNGCWCAWRQV